VKPRMAARRGPPGTWNRQRRVALEIVYPTGPASSFGGPARSPVGDRPGRPATRGALPSNFNVDYIAGSNDGALP
jgi:hypothetical protein